MNKKKFLAGSLVLFGLLPMFAFATLNESEEIEAMKSSSDVETRNRGIQLEAELKLKAEREAREANREGREEQKNTIKANIEAKREAVQEAVKERREAVAKQVLERLEKFISTVVTRFESAVERLDTLSARIQSRIDKLAEAGIDVSESQKSLDEAKTKIQLAKDEVAKIKPKADEVVGGDARALYPELKEVVGKAKEAIKEAHSALIEVVKGLKPGQQKLEAKVKTEVESETKIEDQNS